MSKLLNNALSVYFLQKQLGFLSLSQAVTADLRWQKLDRPKGDKILVLAPHPDDDVLGCGGTLVKHVQAKNDVRITYFFDCIDKRVEEAKNATKILGISADNLHFNVDKAGLASLISRLQPDIIYLPNLVDNHPAHRECSRILFEIISEGKFANRLAIVIYQYEVWAPIFPNRTVPIDEKLKERAIQEHKSQLGNPDYSKEWREDLPRRYDKAILGLNQYRGESMAVGPYAEAFFACPLELWIRLYKKIYN